MKTGDFTRALIGLMEELEYDMYVSMATPTPLFFLLDQDYVPLPVMSRAEWNTHRGQLHPTRFDLDYRLLPEQIYRFPGNYEWWRLPEEDEEDL